MARIIPRRRPAASSADRSSQWLAAIIDSSDDAIVSKDLQGVIHSWNEGARRLFGYDAAEIIGQSVTILIPADRQDEETEILGRIRRGEKVDHHETIRRRKDGTLVEVSLTVSPIKDASGRIIGASKIARDLTDRKAVERIMRQGNERFRLLANHAPVGIFLSNRAGECVFVNECWCALSGLTFAQALDAGWTQALHPADRERVLADWRQAVAAGRASAAEFRFLRPDGTIVWLQGNAVPFQDGDRFQGYLGSCQDVTRRKQAELQAAFLQGLTDRLAGVTGSTRIKEITQHALGEHLSADRCCFVEINAGGDTATLDRDWHRPDLASLAGRYRLAEPGRPGWHDQLALPRQQIADVNALAAPLEVRAALAGHQIRSVASTAFRQDGRWAFTLAATSRRPRRWNSEELDLLENVAARISPAIQRARAIDALRESEQLYRAIGESIDYGSWVCDAEGRNLYASDSFLRLVGLTPAQCAGFNWVTLLPPEEREATTAAWLECVRTGKIWEREHRFKGVDGQWHYVLARGVPIRDPRGRITRWAGLNLDISDRKRAENNERFLGQLVCQLGLLTEPGEILRIAAAEIGRELGVDRCGLVEQTAPEGRAVCLSDWTPEGGPASPAVEQLVGAIPSEVWGALAKGPVVAVAEATPPPPAGGEQAGGQVSAVLPAFAVAPLNRHVNWVAALVVGCRAPRAWRRDELELLEKAVARIRPIVEQARSARALQLSEKRHRELLACLPVACYTLDADNRINFFNDAAAELWGRRPVLHEERWCGSWEMAGLDGSPMPLDRCPAAQASQNGRSVRGEEAFIIRPDGTRRWVAPYPTPLFDAHGRRAGLINVLIDVTEQRAAQQAEAQRLRSLEVLNRAGNALVAEHELVKIVQAVTDAGREVSGAAFGAFYYNQPNEKGDAYTLSALSGLPQDSFAPFPMPHAAELLGPTFRGERAVRLSDALQDPRHWKHAPHPARPAEHLPVRSYLAAPVISRSGEILGGLFFGHPQPGVFTQEAETVLVALAAQAAIAIDNARLYVALQNELVERRHKELLLRDSEMRWRQLAEAMPHLVWTCRADGMCDFLSPQWVAYTGAPEVDQLGEGWLEFIHPADRDGLVATWNTAVETGGPFDTEFRIRRVDGQYRWFKTRAVPIRDSEGRIVKWYGSNTDIEDYRRIEQAIRDSEHHLRLVADHAPVFLAHCNREHRFKFVNQPYAQRYQLTREEIIGRHLSEVIGPAAYAAFRPHLNATLTGQRTEFEQEIPYPTLGRRWVHVIYEPERNGAGEVVGLVAVISDVTARKQEELELKRARDEAVAASRAKDDFFAALSHELRTPLSPVLLVASDAANNPALPREIRDNFEMIRSNVSLEARLIDDLLDLTRIERGKMHLEKQEIDLHDVLRDAVNNIRAEFEDKHLDLVLSLTAEKSHVLGDAVRLQQVLWNVLKNAVKFTPQDGRIEVRTRLAAGDGPLLIEIADNGIGLSSAELERVFEAFAQGEHAAHPGAQRFGGLGLGLAISRKLLELHHGRIHARSPGRNLGSTFVVELPLAPGPHLPARESAKAGDPRGTEPGPAAMPQGRVLLVEDHASTRATVKKLLVRRDYEVEAAGTAGEARALAAARHFDFLVSDVGLPDGNGYQLMAELRQLQPQLQGIAMSGYGMEEDLQRSRAAGFTAHLVKPVSIAALEQALARRPSPSPTFPPALALYPVTPPGAS